MAVFAFCFTADLAAGLEATAGAAFLAGVTFLAATAFLAGAFEIGAFDFGESLDAAAFGGVLTADLDFWAALPAFFFAAARLGDHFGAFFSEMVFGALALLAFGLAAALPAAGFAALADAGLTGLVAAGLAPLAGAGLALPLAGGAPLTGNVSFLRLKA